MTFLEAYSGSYDQAMGAITSRRVAISQRVDELTPFDVEAAAKPKGPEDDPKISLDWVKIINPRSDAENPVGIDVEPVLICGWVDDESGFSSVAAVTGLDLMGRLPSGEEQLMGSMSLDSDDQSAYLYLYPASSAAPSYVRWDSADAELFLTLVESALAAQPTK